MECDKNLRTVILEGPAEIIPILRAIGDLSVHHRVFAPDALVEIPVADACIAVPRVHDSTWGTDMSQSESSGLRNLAEELALHILHIGGLSPHPEE